MRLAKATALVASVVFWLRIAPTSESSTDLRAGGEEADPGVAGAVAPWRIVYGVGASAAGAGREVMCVVSQSSI